MAMPNRNYAVGGTNYRYNHNGQERDDEIFEGANTAEYWEYDSRLGRRWEQDPVVKEWLSPYCTFDNNPILYSDPDGDDINWGKGLKGAWNKVKTKVKSWFNKGLRQRINEAESDHDHTYTFREVDDLTGNTPSLGDGGIVNEGKNPNDKTRYIDFARKGKKEDHDPGRRDINPDSKKRKDFAKKSEGHNHNNSTHHNRWNRFWKGVKNRDIGWGIGDRSTQWPRFAFGFGNYNKWNSRFGRQTSKSIFPSVDDFFMIQWRGFGKHRPIQFISLGVAPTIRFKVGGHRVDRTFHIHINLLSKNRRRGEKPIDFGK